MCERRQVAGCADAAMPRDRRMDPAVDHVAEEIDDLGPDPGPAGGKGVGAEYEDRADDVFSERRPDADGMAPQEIALQRAELVVRNAHGREVAEARVDAVDRVVRLGDLCDDLRRLLDLALGGPVQPHGHVTPRDRHDVRDGEVVTGEPEGGYFRFSRYQAPSLV